MDSPILYQGVGGLLIVFFLVLIYFFTKTWRWFHIVCVVFVFGASIFLIRNTAAVYRTLSAWRSLVARTDAQLAKLVEENELLRYGRFDDTEQSVESTRLLHAKIDRMILDRGRVWRNCTPTPQADGTVLVNTVAPGAEAATAEAAAPAAPPAAAAPGAAAVPGSPAPGAPAAAPAPVAPAGPPANRIQDQTVLHVFLEEVPPPETGVPAGVKVPYYYIGDFVAVAVTDTTVTLRPLTPLTAADTAVVRKPNSTWTLHETMPIDGHEWFASDPDRLPSLAQSADVEPVFGKFDEAQTRAILLWPRFLPEFFSDPAVYQSAVTQLNTTVESYLRDGKSVPVANKDDFPPGNVWMEVRFLKPHKEVVDTTGSSVSPFSPGITDDFFDRGLAEVAILKLGHEAEFEVDDTAVFPQAEAQQLINAGICEFREYIYVRRLNDYVYLFKNFERRFDRVGDDSERTQRDIAAFQSTQTNLTTQVASVNDDQVKLNQDLAKTKDEAAKIAGYLATLEEAWTRMRQQLSLLYRANLQLEEEMDQLHREMTNEVNRRISQSVAEN